MLPIPNLPTDNLYKFLALSGLTLSFVAVAYLYLEEKNFIDRYAGLKEISSRLELEDSMYVEPATKSPGKTAVSELRQHSHTIDSLYREEKVRLDVIQMQTMDHDSIRKTCLGAGVIGIIVAVLGLQPLVRTDSEIPRHDSSCRGNCG